MENFTSRLNKCKICGSQPKGTAWYGDENMNPGYAKISCSCGAELTKSPLGKKIPVGMYRDSWEMHGYAMRGIIEDLIYQWNKWNPKKECK